MCTETDSETTNLIKRALTVPNSKLFLCDRRDRKPFVKAGWIACFTANDRVVQTGRIMRQLLSTRVQANAFLLMGYWRRLTLPSCRLAAIFFMEASRSL